MKQLPETIEPNIQRRKKGVFRSVAIVIICVFVWRLIGFFTYCPNAKDNIVLWVIYCIGNCVCVAGKIFLNLLNKPDTEKLIVQKCFKYRKRIKVIIQFLSVVLVFSFICVFLYVFPRSFAPKIIDGKYKLHEETEDPTDICVIVETNLTVETVSLRDNGVEKACFDDYDQKGMRHVFSEVLFFDAEDNSDHVFTVRVKANGRNEVADEKKLLDVYNPGKYQNPEIDSSKLTFTPTPILTPTSAFTPTSTSKPDDKGQDELEIVCIPQKKLETEEGIREFCSYISSASITKLVDIYSGMASSELDAFFVLTTDKKLTRIMLDSVSETTVYPPCYMKKVSEGIWYFDADFIENSMFEIDITAYGEDGKVYYDKIEVQFPFE